MSCFWTGRRQGRTGGDGGRWNAGHVWVRIFKSGLDVEGGTAQPPSACGICPLATASRLLRALSWNGKSGQHLQGLFIPKSNKIEVRCMLCLYSKERDSSVLRQFKEYKMLLNLCISVYPTELSYCWLHAGLRSFLQDEGNISGEWSKEYFTLFTFRAWSLWNVYSGNEILGPDRYL